MATQRGFTLIELMVVIAIIAILSATGIPAYQRYLQQAAMTDMLQAMVPYKMAVELCSLEQGSLSECHAGSQSIPESAASRYVSRIDVKQGVITLVGAQSLQGLTLLLTPVFDPSGSLRWTRQCNSTNNGLQEICQVVFRFDNTVKAGEIL